MGGTHERVGGGRVSAGLHLTVSLALGTSQAPSLAGQGGGLAPSWTNCAGRPRLGPHGTEIGASFESWGAPAVLPAARGGRVKLELDAKTPAGAGRRAAHALPFRSCFVAARWG
jgi:hypothetical protein